MKRNALWLTAVAMLMGNVVDTITTTRDTAAQEVAPDPPEESKYTLKVPGGLAFSEFRGYEDWAVVAVHHTGELIKAVVGNPVAVNAFRSGIPGNGKPFPDGAKVAKVEWTKGSNPSHNVTLPGTVYDVDFMVKDSKRFADSGGWGYAVFKRDSSSGAYTPATLTHKPPQGNDAKCGFACHTPAKTKDYVFTDYANR